MRIDLGPLSYENFSLTFNLIGPGMESVAIVAVSALALAVLGGALKSFTDEKKPLQPSWKWSSPTHLSQGKLILAPERKGFELSRTIGLTKTPLHHAFFAKQFDLIPFLIEQGADVDAVDENGNTVLHFAAEFGFEDVVRQLLEFNPDTTIRNHRDETAQLLSIKNHHDPITLALICLSPPPRSRPHPKPVNELSAEQSAKIKRFIALLPSPLHNAVLDDKTDLIPFLVAHGVNVNAQNKQGNTPLHFAWRCSLMNGVRGLLKFNPNPFIKNKRGETAMQAALRNPRFFHGV